MFPANSFVIRPATPADAPAIELIARLDSDRAPRGPILIGELDGAPAAALGLDDGRLIADPFQATAQLAARMRVRAAGMTAHRRTPSLSQRLRAGVRIAPRAPLAA